MDAITLAFADKPPPHKTPTIHLPCFLSSMALFFHLTHSLVHIVIWFAICSLQWNGSSSGQRFLLLRATSPFLEYSLANNIGSWKIFERMKFHWKFSIPLAPIFFFKWTSGWYYIFKIKPLPINMLSFLIWNFLIIDESQRVLEHFPLSSCLWFYASGKGVWLKV